MNQANNVTDPSDLETLLTAQWFRSTATGNLMAVFPNRAGYWVIEGNKVLSFWYNSSREPFAVWNLVI